jgi:hypothetical protein
MAWELVVRMVRSNVHATLIDTVFSLFKRFGIEWSRMADDLMEFLEANAIFGLCRYSTRPQSIRMFELVEYVWRTRFNGATAYS